MKIASKPLRVIDLGGTVDYWRRVGVDFLVANDIEIAILNHHASELGAGGPFRLVVGDACKVDAPDRAYDFVHSNSVVEHLLTWENMEAFAREVRRLGRGYYVQTPNWWFPIDPHFYKVPFFHWLPKEVRARLLHTFPIAFSGKIRPMESARQVVDGAQLLTLRQMQLLFPNARITPERFLGLNKSLIAIR